MTNRGRWWGGDLLFVSCSFFKNRGGSEKTGKTSRRRGESGRCSPFLKEKTKASRSSELPSEHLPAQRCERRGDIAVSGADCLRVERGVGRRFGGMKKHEKAQWPSPSAGKRQRLSLFFSLSLPLSTQGHHSPLFVTLTLPTVALGGSTATCTFLKSKFVHFSGSAFFFPLFSTLSPLFPAPFCSLF